MIGPMNFALLFVPSSCRYSVHAANCPACVTKANMAQFRVPVEFESIEAAHKWADEDEQGKGGDKAIWRVCKCTKGV